LLRRSLRTGGRRRGQKEDKKGLGMHKVVSNYLIDGPVGPVIHPAPHLGEWGLTR
jgi:hypothetical protein